MSTINAPVPMTVSCDNKAVQMNVGMKITTGTTSVTDKEPYLFRASAAGSADVAVNKIIGGTVAWNQIAKKINSTDWKAESSVTATFGDGEATFSYPSTGGNGIATRTNVSFVKDHKYVVLADVKSPTVISARRIFIGGSSTSRVRIEANITTTDTWVAKETIVNCNASTSSPIYAYVSGEAYTDLSVRNVMVFDLTAMFGSAIADYAYTLESGTAGAGIAWLKKYGWFTKPYYPYKAAALESVKTSAHKTIGFNQWDEQWELGGLVGATGAKYSANDRIRSKNFCRCVPSTAYYCKAPNVYTTIWWYDASKGFIKWESAQDATNQKTVTSPSDAAYFKLVIANNTTTYGNNLCINLHWDGERDGEYEPYEQHTYALDDVELRGIPKLDASNNLYYDGDTYESDGTVTRRYAIRAFTSGDATDGSTMITDGTNTVYKLATPTTETADPYTNPQKVDASGTEEYVDSREVPIPVGHETQYVTRQTAETSVDAYPMTVTHGIEV